MEVKNKDLNKELLETGSLKGKYFAFMCLTDVFVVSEHDMLTILNRAIQLPNVESINLDTWLQFNIVNKDNREASYYVAFKTKMKDMDTLEYVVTPEELETFNNIVHIPLSDRFECTFGTLASFTDVFRRAIQIERAASLEKRRSLASLLCFN
jgi:hypothetical protein